MGRGRRLFFGEKVACSSCHTIGTEGGHVGPDLTGIGAIRSGHDLLEAIVFPSASFVPGHEVFNVDTGNDRLSGVIRSQTAKRWSWSPALKLKCAFLAAYKVYHPV